MTKIKTRNYWIVTYADWNGVVRKQVVQTMTEGGAVALMEKLNGTSPKDIVSVELEKRRLT
jgi:hypothetical protein